MDSFWNLAMFDSPTFDLRIFSQEDGARVVGSESRPADFVSIALQLEELSGWKFTFDASGKGTSGSKGVFVVDDLSEAVNNEKRALSRASCDRVAKDLTTLHHTLSSLQDSLRFANVELSANAVQRVALTDAQKLDTLFHQLLVSACELTGFDSAAISVWNPNAGDMAFRVVNGQHFDEHLGVKRALKDSKVDLEALAGSVVVLTKKSEMAVWNAPANCQTAVCIPISSLDNLIGTLWLTSERRKNVSDSQCNLLEIIAGRIASELERVSLVTKIKNDANRGELNSDEFLGEPDQLIQPPFPDWSCEIQNSHFGAGCSEGPGALWRVNHEDQLAVLAYDFRGNQAYEQRRQLVSAFEHLIHLSLTPDQMLAALNQILRYQFSTNELEGLGCLIVEPLTGEVLGAAQGEFFVDSRKGDFPLESAENFFKSKHSIFIPRQGSITICHPVYEWDEFQATLFRR
ncbi:MAG: GAF domain-containing protein [Pirellulaceae bacterium]